MLLMGEVMLLFIYVNIGYSNFLNILCCNDINYINYISEEYDMIDAQTYKLQSHGKAAFSQGKVSSWCLHRTVVEQEFLNILKKMHRR